MTLGTSCSKDTTEYEPLSPLAFVTSSSSRTVFDEISYQFKDQPFYVPTPLGERLQIPVRYVDELRAGSIEELDFPGTFFEMFEGKYTTMGDRSQLHPHITRVNLTANIRESSGRLRSLG